MPKKQLETIYQISRLKSYLGYKSILVEKIKALTGIDGGKLFVDVLDVNEDNKEGYPVCWVLEQTGKGQILDTHRNEREWQFAIVIHQEVKQKDRRDAYMALVDAADRVIKAIDEDPMLADPHGQARCKFVKVMPAFFEYAAEELPLHKALLEVAIVDIVNRYIPA